MISTSITRELEQSLVSLQDTCYEVALQLTKDPVAAGRLAQETLLRAWAEREFLEVEFGIKMALLSRLRATYLQKYRNPTRALPRMERFVVPN